MSKGAMLTLARRVARERDGGVFLRLVPSWLGSDWGVQGWERVEDLLVKVPVVRIVSTQELGTIIVCCRGVCTS